MSPEPLCPRCINEPLTPDGDDAEFLHCAQCHGTLLPAMKVPEEFRYAAAENSAPTSDPPDATAASEPLVCPVCAGRMPVVPLGGDAMFLCESCGRGWMESVTDEKSAEQETPEKAANRLTRYLLYSVSLPERMVRSTVGMTAGLAKESAALLIPQAFQNSKTYEVVVKNSLKFLTEDVGGVERDPNDVVLGQDFVARKAVGNFVDLAGWATFAVSPVWMMAIVSDVAYGTKSYVHELAAELKKKGYIDETSTIHSVDDLLAAVKEASGQAASLVDTPPLSVDQLKESLNATRQALTSVDVRKVLPEAELKRYWQEMREISDRENVSLIGVSGALTMHSLGKLGTVTRGALTGVQVVGGLLNRTIIGHYSTALNDIREKGFYQTVRESSEPYIAAVWNNFAIDRSTWTEELVSGRAIGKAWTKMKGLFSREKTSPEPLPSEPG